MLRSTASKVMWVGRATVFLVGLSVILALVFGVATTALGANGQNFILGKAKNAATKVTGLVGNVDGASLRVTNPNTGTNDTALALRVQAGEAPMKVNSDTRVANLNADKLDGMDASEIGINGLQRIEESSAENSDSPKQVTASCPSSKVLVGTGFDVFGGKSGTSPNALNDVMMDFVIPGSTSVTVAAYEDEATSANWRVTAFAICATGGTP